jgi:hypothetical protein
MTQRAGLSKTQGAPRVDAAHQPRAGQVRHQPIVPRSGRTTSRPGIRRSPTPSRGTGSAAKLGAGPRNTSGPHRAQLLLPRDHPSRRRQHRRTSSSAPAGRMYPSRRRERPVRPDLPKSRCHRVQRQVAPPQGDTDWHRRRRADSRCEYSRRAALLGSWRSYCLSPSSTKRRVGVGAQALVGRYCRPGDPRYPVGMSQLAAAVMPSQL